MDWDVVDVKVTGEHALFVRFKDGVEGELKFTPSFFSGVFTHLIDPAQFGTVKLVGGVVTWPEELDLAPDAMHDEIKRNGVWIIH
jgi:hypothetical protein